MPVKKYNYFINVFLLLIQIILFYSFPLFSSSKSAYELNQHLNAMQSFEPTADKPDTPLVFVLCVGSPSEVRKAEMLIKSLRTFGGKYRDSLVYVVYEENGNTPFEQLKSDNVRFLPLKMDGTPPGYPFVRKVYACALVEKLIAGEDCNLVWFDNECLVLAPPEELELKADNKVALRPVFLQNKVGLEADTAVDYFWSEIYKAAGANAVDIPIVETLVDGKKVRFYINCQAMSIKPDLGICAEWERIFTTLSKNEEYMNTACPDFLHRLFLHQAVLSAVLVSKLKPEEMHWFSKPYGYTMQQHEKLPPEKKLEKVNDVVCLIYDELFDSRPDWMDVMTIEEPLRTWLFNSYIESLRVNDRIYRVEGACNTYLVKTPEGNVLIDPGGTSKPSSWLFKVNGGNPLRAIIITHAHEDHIQGISLLKKDSDIPVIAQREHVEFMRYSDRLARFFAMTKARHFGLPFPKELPSITESKIEPTVFFTDSYNLKVGGLDFEIIHTPGETYDTATVWIPELKAAIVGDNYFGSFPNIYTLRGTKPRWALDYINSLDTVLKLEPEFLLPGHEEPIIGKDRVRARLTEYRDAIRYVHDETVKGINEGKDVFTLMKEIKLPEKFKNVGEYYGRVSWSVRGIYDGYVGWFDGNVSNMNDQPASSIFPEIIELSGGKETLAEKAMELVKKGEDVKALHMTDIVLAVDSLHKPSLEAKLETLKSLLSKCRNWIERNWLNSEIKRIQRLLKAGNP